MERFRKPVIHGKPNVNPVEKSIAIRSWKKVGGGSFYLGDRLIKPGEIFRASESEIPMVFRDVVIGLGSGGREDFVPITKARKIEFILQASQEEEGLFDIVDLKGKKMNEASLPFDKASEFLIDLEK